MSARCRGLDLVELRIVVVVVLLVAGAGGPWLLHRLNRERNQAVECLVAMAAAADGDASANCPACHRPIPVTAGGAVCPDPGRHLQPDTRLLRKGLEQTLSPRPAVLSVRSGDVVVALEETPEEATLRVTPVGWARWVVWPFVGFILGGLASAALFAWGPAAFRREPEPTLAKVLVALVLTAIATLLLFPVEQTIAVSREPRRLTLRSRPLGLPRERVYADVVGVAALKVREGYRLVAVVKEDGIRTGLDLVSLTAEQLPLVSGLQGKPR